MSLPYENATSGTRALDDTQKILTRFGCSRFGTMTDNAAGEILVQFSHRGRDVSIKASFRGYASAWMKAHPYSYRMKKNRTDYERAAMVQAQISTCSILRDWIKGQVTAIEVGLLSFEGAFLGQILLPTGLTILDYMQSETRLLAAPEAA